MARPRGGRQASSLRSSLRRAEYWAVAGIALSVAVFAGAALLTSGPAVITHIASLTLGTFLGLLGLSLVNYATRVVRWQVFSGQLGVAVPPTRNALYYVAGFALTVTPGKVGETLRLWLLNQGHGYRYERTAGLLLGDRLSDASALLLLCFSGITLFAANLWATGAAAVLILGATFLFLWPRLLLDLVGWLYGRLGRWPRRFAQARILLRQTGKLASWRVYGGTLVLSMVGWLAECAALHWLLAALGTPLTFGQSIFVFSSAMLVGAAAMLPGGLGGTEAGMVGLLVALGVDLDAAIAATAVVRVTTLWFAVALGFLTLPLALRAVAAKARQ